MNRPARSAPQDALSGLPAPVPVHGEPAAGPAVHAAPEGFEGDLADGRTHPGRAPWPDGLPVAVLVLAATGEVLAFNASASDLLGLGARPASARLLHRLLATGPDRDRARAALQQARLQGRSTVDGLRFDTVGGGFTGELRVSCHDPSPDDSAGLQETVFVCVVIDHSDPAQTLRMLQDASGGQRDRRALLAASARLLAAKESAEQASRSKSAFLARMSHELRTPLNAIYGFAQLMRLQAEAGDLVLRPHRVQLIENAARHLLELVDEVLDLSRIDSGHLELRPAALDLREAVAESLALVQPQALQAGVELLDDTAAGPPLPAWADRLRLKEVLINLMSNGVKYNRPGGRLRISGGLHPGGGVSLAVEDTGFGLDAAQIGSLFEPFNRLGAEAGAIEGTGMGLYLSRCLMHLMGGAIEVASEPGRGSCFTLRLGAPPA